MGDVNLKTIVEFVKYVSAPFKRRLFPWPRAVEADRILGIACTGHGASLAYIDSSGQMRCSQLERWTGTKHMMMFSAEEDHDLRYPKSALDEEMHYVFCEGFGRFPDSCIFEDTIIPWVEWLGDDLGVHAKDIDLVVTSSGHFATGWARLGSELHKWFPNAQVARDIEHHDVHQRQAFWPSGFREAAVLTLDTCGESLPRLGGQKLAGTIAIINRHGCQVVKELLFPRLSAGAIYDTTTHHIGFRQGEEGKTMGLAAFGEPELYEQLQKRLHLYKDGSFSFLGSQEFQHILDAYVPLRSRDAEINQRHMNVAYAGQAVLDEIVANAWQAALDLTNMRTLVYAGGVALNSVANEKAYARVRPQHLYISPNPGDPGQALGCALFGAYELAGWPPPQRELSDYLGPLYTPQMMQAAAEQSGYPVDCPQELETIAARCIANGHIVARFEGQAEFGPRALGNRSILCDPRRAGMKDYLNSRVKHREGFRPFAPTVLQEYAHEWFDLDVRSPYMLRVVPIRPDKIELIPAVAHVDGTARVQTLSNKENPGYYRLINAFREITNIPLVLNTSFNIAGKPIVEKPQDALECFKQTEIDVMLLGPFVISKQPLDHYLEEESCA